MKRNYVREQVCEIVEKDLDMLCQIRILQSKILDKPIEYQHTIDTSDTFKNVIIDELTNKFCNHPEELNNKVPMDLLIDEIRVLYKRFANHLYLTDKTMSNKTKYVCYKTAITLSKYQLQKTIELLERAQ